MENWQPVKGYDGIYEVSDKGRVRSLNYNHTGTDRILKPRKNGDGYLQVGLWKDGHVKTVRIHRLVAEAFIQNPNNLETVNHKDEVKTNNTVSNLEWMSKKDNNNYGSRTIRASKANTNNPKRSKQVQMFDKSTGELLASFPSTHEAERVTGIYQGNICSCCKGKYKSAGGYVWRYS